MRLELCGGVGWGRLLVEGQDADFLLSFPGPDEIDPAVYLCKQRMIATHADILAGRKNGPTLANEDVAGLYDLAPESLHAQSL